jgi:hypothetical protein
MVSSESEHFQPSPEDVALAYAVNRYKDAWHADKLTPEVIREFWQAFWNERTFAALEPDFDLPNIDHLTQERLSALRKENRAVVLIPEPVLEDWQLLGRLFPEADLDPTLGKHLLHGAGNRPYGNIVAVEMTPETPNESTTFAEIRSHMHVLSEGQRLAQRLPVYIAASAMSELVNGEGFDRRTVSWIDGTQFNHKGHPFRMRDESFRHLSFPEENPRALLAGFAPNGVLNMAIISPRGSDQKRGYRTEQKLLPK